VIKVILADDHHLVRQGIRSLLEDIPGIEIVAEAENGEEAVRLVQRLTPDVLVTDINMPRLNGIQAAEKIRELKLSTRVVILSIHATESLVRQSLRSGVKGYVLKSSVKDELFLAIQAAYRGATFLSPTISDLVAADMAAGQAESVQTDSFSQLSLREQQILKLIAEGYSNKAIAEMMNLSIKTIEKDRARLTDKLKIYDLAGLIRLALKHGLISLDE
jgi:DNA-binding NarL/FixJ family response regulator